MPEDNLWGVFVKADSTIQPSQNIVMGTGQVTIVAPTGFEVANLTSYMGSWVQNATVKAPVENKEKDYISFGIRLVEAVSELGVYDEVLVLTFGTTDADCPSSLSLIESDDPFVTTVPNSLNTNPGNDLRMVDIGNGRRIYDYKGNYDLEAWNCSDPSNVTTSLKDFQREQSIKVYPNPFENELIFERIDRQNNTNYQIQLRDNLGRLIRSEKMDTPRFEIQVEASSALYFYQIMDLDQNRLVAAGKLLRR
ncbi:MAG: T9SS type A sorting domain-containing protein [Bacteroidota bacterium]